ncbi:MAG: MFS transporter [Chitinophagales bacterium]
MIKNRIAVNILFGMNGFLYANYTARLPQIQSLYGLDNGDLGISLLIMAIGALIAMPFTGWLIVKNSSRRIATFAGLAFCSMVPLIGMMPNIVLFDMLFFSMGLGTGMMDVGMNAQAIAVEKSYRRPIMSSFHAIFSAGMMFGAGSGALFMYLGFNLLPHLVVVSSLALISLLWAVSNLIDDGNGSTATTTKHTPFSLPKASLVGVGLIAFCCMLGEGAMANWSTNYMLHIANANASFAPLGLVAFSSAMMLARFFGDHVRHQVGDRKLLIGNSILAGVGLGLLLIVPHPVVVLIGFFLVGLGLSVIVPIAYSTAGNTPDLPPSVGIGMVTTIGYSGLLLGPPIIGFLAEWQNMQVALSFTLLLFVLMIGLSFRFQSVRSA